MEPRVHSEIDLIGADRAPVARKIYYAGSVKWLDQPFDNHDLAGLRRDIAQIPGVDPGSAGLIAVSRAGFTDTTAGHLDLCWRPADALGAFA